MFDEEKDRLFWQVEALKGQVIELERSGEKTGNQLWAFRVLILSALEGLGYKGNFTGLTDTDLLYTFHQVLENDWRFSRCPNASKMHCRPLALQTTRDGDLVGCLDCGWDVRENPLPRQRRLKDEQ